MAPVATLSHPDMAASALQLRVAVPARVSLTLSSNSQSRTRARLTLGSDTAPPLAQAGTSGGWAGVKVSVLSLSGVMSA